MPSTRRNSECRWLHRPRRNSTSSLRSSVPRAAGSQTTNPRCGRPPVQSRPHLMDASTPSTPPPLTTTGAPEPAGAGATAPIPPAVGAPVVGIGHRVARGFTWGVANTVAGKFASLAGNFALAWLLMPRHFGLIQLAFTVSAIANIFQAGGQREILIRRQARFDRWSEPAFWLSLASGLLSSAIMIAAAPIAARFYEEPAVVGLLYVLALVPPLNALATVPMAYAQIHFQFRLINVVGAAVTFGTVLLTVVLALPVFGWGAYALAVPLPVMALLRLIVLWRATGLRFPRRLRLRRWRFLLLDSGLWLLGWTGLTLISQGDYIMLGRFHLEEMVGVYALAFNLSMQTMILLSFNLDSVLLPGLSKLQVDPARQREAFLNVVRTVTLVGMFASLLQAALADPGVHALFPPRLYVLVPVIQLLSIGMAMRMGGWSSQTMLQAQGRFKTYMLLNVIGATAFLTMVGFASWRASNEQAPVYVAIAAAVYFTFEGPIALYLAIRPGGGTWGHVARTYASPIVIAVASISSEE